jgi:hypothetical protein
MELFIQIAGWTGTILIVGAFFLNSNNKLSSGDKTYQLMNLFGAICIGINVFHNHAWPAVALQVVWGLIAIASIIKSYKLNSDPKKH